VEASAARTAVRLAPDRRAERRVDLRLDGGPDARNPLEARDGAVVGEDPLAVHERVRVRLRDRADAGVADVRHDDLRPRLARRRDEGVVRVRRHHAAPDLHPGCVVPADTPAVRVLVRLHAQRVRGGAERLVEVVVSAGVLREKSAHRRIGIVAGGRVPPQP
jgi:hypothetical protein